MVLSAQLEEEEKVVGANAGANMDSGRDIHNGGGVREGEGSREANGDVSGGSLERAEAKLSLTNGHGVEAPAGGSPTRRKHPSAGNNMVIYSSSEGFPRPAPSVDGAGADTELTALAALPPFVEVAGEGARHCGRTKDGAPIILTNFRLYVSASSSSPLVNVPLGSLEVVELRELFFIHLSCKDGRCYRVALADNAAAERWHLRIRQSVSPPAKMEDIFALAHFAWAQEDGAEEYDGDHVREYSFPGFDDEVSRLHFDVQGSWRVSEANREYKLCETYPRRLIVPAGITDEHVRVVADYRAGRRIPAAVWRHPRTGAVLARCSQPEVGIMGWRSEKDEKYFEALGQSCHYDQVRGVSSSFSATVSEDGGSVADADSVSGRSSVNAETGSDSVDSQVLKLLFCTDFLYTNSYFPFVDR